MKEVMMCLREARNYRSACARENERPRTNRAAAEGLPRETARTGKKGWASSLCDISRKVAANVLAYGDELILIERGGAGLDVLLEDSFYLCSCRGVVAANLCRVARGEDGQGEDGGAVREVIEAAFTAGKGASGWVCSPVAVRQQLWVPRTRRQQRPSAVRDAHHRHLVDFL